MHSGHLEASVEESWCSTRPKTKDSAGQWVQTEAFAYLTSVDPQESRNLMGAVHCFPESVITIEEPFKCSIIGVLWLPPVD